jgi:hypothetical protein
MQKLSQTNRKYNKIYNLHAVPIWILMVGLILIAAITIWSFVIHKRVTFWMIIFIIYLLVFYILVELLGKGIKKNDRSYGLGADVEELVGSRLYTIGDDFKVVHDISKGKKIGNIDHVVVGPTGIFVVESKANRNWVYAYENNIRKNTALGEKFTKQIAGNALWMHNLIKEQLGIEKFVHGVVSRPLNKDRRIDMCCASGVCIMDGDTVCDYIKSYQDKLNEEEINKISSFLNKIKRNN